MTPAEAIRAIQLRHPRKRTGTWLAEYQPTTKPFWWVTYRTHTGMYEWSVDDNDGSVVDQTVRHRKKTGTRWTRQW